MKGISVIFVALLLQACVTTPEGPHFTEVEIPVREDKATVIVYRLYSTTGMVWPANFYVGGNKVAKLDNGGFQYIHVEPGVHTISHGTDSNPFHKKVEVSAEANKTYYVSLYRGMPDELKVVEEGKAVEMLSSPGFAHQPFMDTP